MNKNTRVGIDFDNTIICYDTVFNTVAVEKGLIPEGLDRGKGHVKDYLIKNGREKQWTQLQGYVYGTQLPCATIYDGVKRFVEFCRSRNYECVIISHKTQYPYAGEKYDLHQSAMDWIHKQKLGLDVFFEATKEDKVNRIRSLGCNFFIDDLPEFLALPGFSSQIIKILFDPLKKYDKSVGDYQYASSWDQILDVVKHAS